MNRHYLREPDFEQRADAEQERRYAEGRDRAENPPDDQESEPAIDISREMMRATIWIGTALCFVITLGCWYGLYLIGIFLYDLAVSN